MVELLAPAGDLERLKIALKYGADAVYIGYEKLSLRANAVNFTFEEIKEAVNYAHNLGKKVYVTVNIVLHNEDLQEIETAIEGLSKVKVDALIISDPAIFKYAKKYNLDIHLSTQASTMNYKTVQFFENEGIKRVVLARELNREEIKDIISKTHVEIETFIHGAMCAGISGRCVMSNFFTLRDANRGGCSQVCRWNFTLLDEKKKALGDDNFTFCSKDLSMIEYIKDMISIGIKSFKIEGRMRSSYYLATVISIYRKVIDNCCKHSNTIEYNIKDKKVLSACANRDSTCQFYNGNYDNNCSYYNGRVEISNQDFLGIVKSYDEKTKLATIEQRNYFKSGDIVEIFSPNRDIITKEIKEIYDEDNNIIEIVRHPKQIVKIYIDEKLEKDDMIRIKKD